MNIFLLGATGKTGQQVLTQAQAAGHHITAFVRNPAKLSQSHENLTVIAGDALNESAVEAAMQSAPFDAVITTIGGDSLKNKGVCARSTANVVAAMQKQHPEAHLWVVSSAGTGDSYNQLDFFGKVFVRTVIAGPIRDHTFQEQTVQNSRLNYTIVRPVSLTDNPASGGAYVVKAQGKMPSSRIPRVDVAHFIIHNLTGPAYQRTAVALSASS